MARRYDAVLFDLLTALVDSRKLWNEVAGNPEDGGRWRAAYLHNTYRTGRYRAYQVLVAEAAAEVGLPRRFAEDLTAKYEILEPWPEVPAVLAAAGQAFPLGIVTNCSEALGQTAAARIETPFEVIVTAERAGYYKPHRRPYEIALAALGVTAARCLFVAGSPYDLFGTSKLGIATYWHDRVGMAVPAGAPRPLRRETSLVPLLDLLDLPSPRTVD